MPARSGSRLARSATAASKPAWLHPGPRGVRGRVALAVAPASAIDRDDRLASKCHRLADLVGVGLFVPCLEAWVAVVEVVPLAVGKDRHDHVLRGAADAM